MELPERRRRVADLTLDLERRGSGEHREQPSHQPATRIRAHDMGGDDEFLVGHPRHGHAWVEAPLCELGRERALEAVGDRTNVELGRESYRPLPGNGVKSAEAAPDIHVSSPRVLAGQRTSTGAERRTGIPGFRSEEDTAHWGRAGAPLVR